MEAYYIPYDSAHQVGTASWMESLRAAFGREPGITALDTEISNIRSEWTKPGRGRMQCRPKYVTELHQKKQERQQRWAAYLERAVCAALDAAAGEIMKPYNDVITASNAAHAAAVQRFTAANGTAAEKDAAKRVVDAAAQDVLAAGNKAQDVLLIAALPEFFWRDINDNRKHEAPGADRIVGYGKPLYPEVFEGLLKGALSPAAPPAPPASLCALTKKYPNLLVFAGTVWWKEIVDASGCTFGACKTTDLPTGTVEFACTSAVRSCEKMFNTLPVFYQGRCLRLWNKQWISDVDGMGSNYEHLEKFENRRFALSHASVADPLHPAKPVVGLSDPAVVFARDPVFEITLPSGNKATFSTDICLDFAQGYDAANHRATAGPMSRDIGSSQPDYQILVAGGMPFDGRRVWAKEFLLRCDTNWNPGADCAEAYKVGAPAISGVRAAVGQPSPFGVTKLK